jgi:hypothetical protein
MSRIRFTPAVLTLLVMNLIPLIGVMKFGWDAGTIIFLYWLENVIIGVLNIPKILACRDPQRSRDSEKRPIFLAAFFSVHYGGFCLGHYLFLRTTFPELPEFSQMLNALTGSLFIWSLLGLAVSHLLSMGVNFFGKKEYLARTPNKQMFIPYSRIALLHLVIIFSGLLAVAVGQGMAMLTLLVTIKIGFDLAAHLAEHAKVQRDSEGIVF